jgi:integrase
MKIWKTQIEGTNRFVWHGDGTVNGRRLRPRNMATKSEVEAVFDVARALRHQRKYDLPVERPDVTLSDLVAERVRDLDERDGTHKRIRVYLERFRDHFPDDPRVDTLTTADLLSYKRLRARSAGLKPGSINLELGYIGTMLRKAGTYFPSLAGWKPPAMPYEPRDTRGRARVVTDEESDLMLKTLREPRSMGERLAAWRNRQTAADIWELARHTGMRTTELRTMEKSWVDFAEGVVRLPAHVTKSNRTRAVPLNAVAMALLRRRLLESPHPRYFFANGTGTNVLDASSVYSTFIRAARRAKLSYGQLTAGGFRPHDNRHTAVTRMLQAGADMASVGEIVGHSHHTMTLRYSHPSADSKRAAVDLLAHSEGGSTKSRQGVSGGREKPKRDK